MSFDYIVCKKCEFAFSTMPNFYFTNDKGEVRAQMYPSGSQPFEKSFGREASNAVVKNREGFVGDYLCRACHKLSEFADVDEKKCRHCDAVEMIDVYELEGKLCPVCETGALIREPSLVII